MKQLMSLLMVLLMLLVSTGCPLLPFVHDEPLLRGMNYSWWWSGEYRTDDAKRAMNLLPPLGANWIGIVTTVYQDYLWSTSIYEDPEKTMNEADIRTAINNARELGLKVMLKPHLDLRYDDSHWRGDISFTMEGSWQSWFSSYRENIVHYAELAEKLEVEIFCAGTELMGTILRQADWQRVITEVRAVYSGKIVYAAHWGIPLVGQIITDGFEEIDWLRNLDYLGVDAYFPLTDQDNPSIDQLEEAWQPYLEAMKEMADYFQLPILFTEIGYASWDGNNMMPWINFESYIASWLDLQEQADCYLAAFDVTTQQPWFAGWFWWYWQPFTDQGGERDLDFSPYGKPAEDILSYYYNTLADEEAPESEGEAEGEDEPLPEPQTLQAESGHGQGRTMQRSNANGGCTVSLQAGQTQSMNFLMTAPADMSATIQYSNDNSGSREKIDVAVGSASVGSFTAADTGNYGAGWNIFRESPALGPVALAAGNHIITITVREGTGDGYGVEIDSVSLKFSK